MPPPGSYVLDNETLRLEAYRLIALFYANKEIARLADPVTANTAASDLERDFFAREMTRLLLTIAIGTRVLDDQMEAMNKEAPERQAYMTRRTEIDGRRSCMMFDEMSVRAVCNKIIHATVVEPHSTEGATSHEIDEQNWLAWSYEQDDTHNAAGPEPSPIVWRHLSGHVRLGGRHHRERWWHLLDVPIFIEAVCGLLANDLADDACETVKRLRHSDAV